MDLCEYTPAVKNLIQTEVERFGKLNPDVTVSCAALYCDPQNGWIFLNFDSLENTQHFLEDWSDVDDDLWVGRDDNGLFNNSCPDYDYFEFARIDFDEWVDEIESEPVITVSGLGEEHRIDLEEGGDEELNRVVLQWLKGIVQDLEDAGTFSVIQRASTFRLGIQFLDSECEAFWISE